TRFDCDWSSDVCSSDLHGLRPKKDWGQNFLGDEQLLSSLAALARVKAGDWVVELGAGLGHFTRVLASTGAQVVAVERDRELVPKIGRASCRERVWGEVV